jgi:hypothetical protein
LKEAVKANWNRGPGRPQHGPFREDDHIQPPDKPKIADLTITRPLRIRIDMNHRQQLMISAPNSSQASIAEPTGQRLSNPIVFPSVNKSPEASLHRVMESRRCACLSMDSVTLILGYFTDCTATNSPHHQHLSTPPSFCSESENSTFQDSRDPQYDRVSHSEFRC